MKQSNNEKSRLAIERLEKRCLLATLPGDFNADAIVDGEDFLYWQRSPGVGSLSDWQANYSRSLLPPAGLTATASAAGNELDWDDNSDPFVNEYNVYRSDNGGAVFEPIASGVSASSFTDDTVVPGNTYHYIVTAVSDEGIESEFVTETSVTGSGFLAYWSFDNLTGSSVTDDSGNGFDGVLSGATVVDGPVGKAVRFDGIDDFIDLPATAFDSLTDEVTIAFWSNGGPDAPKNSSVFQAAGPGNLILNIHHPWGNENIYWDAAGDRINKLATPSLYKEVWTHWAFTKNASTGEMKIYADGELWHSGTANTGTFDGLVASAARIGGSTNGNTYHNGAIDEFMVFGRELSETEILELALPLAELDQTGLSSRAPMDDAIEDLYGNLLFTPVGGAAVETDSGRFGDAVRLNGSSDGVNVIDPGFSAGNGPVIERTISLWFSADTTSGRQMIFEEGDSDRGFGVYLDGNTLYAGGWDSVVDLPAGDVNAWAGTWRTTSVSAGRWHHLAIVLDATADPTQLHAGAFKAYLNGVEFDPANDMGMQLYPLAYDAGLGLVNGTSLYQSGSTPANLSGYVDEFTVWNRALNSEEVFFLAKQEPVAVEPADFYVAPDGDDSSPGTIALPFATLERARDAVLSLKNSGPSRDFRVLIRGGTYQLENTVKFGVQDSAPNGHTITYEAYPGETPVFTPGVQVSHWRPLNTPVPDLSAVAQNNVWVAPIPGDLQEVYTLFDGDERLQRAREPGFLPSVLLPDSFLSADQSIVIFPEGAVQSGFNQSDWELVIITAASWSMNILPISSINEPARVLKTTIEGMYDLSQPRVNTSVFPESAWIENSFRGLDEPGEWVVDTSEGLLYYWPTDADPGAEIFAPRLTELLLVEGDIDYDGPQDTPVQGLSFKGLSFTQAERYTWTAHRDGWGLQHEWERFDTASAMVRFRGVENSTIEQSRFYNSGATAVRLDLHAQNNVITQNTIEHIGGVGVLLAGYGPGTKDVNRLNQVTENVIHDIGETYWHSPGIMVWQSSENLVSNNLVHDTPYSGIVVSGRVGWNPNVVGEASETVRWDEVESVIGVWGVDYVGRPDWYVREQFLHARDNMVLRNDLHDNVEVLSDGNGIYISGAGADNVIRENYVHDSPSDNILQGIRSDDDQHETIIDRNIIARIGGWSEFVIFKGRSVVTNNIFAYPLNAPNRGMLVLKSGGSGNPGDTDNSVIQRNIFYTNRAGDKIANQSATAGFLSDSDTDFNVYYNEVSSTWAQSHLLAEQQKGSELNSIEANPLFVDASNSDFSFQSGSPATAAPISFIPIDQSVIGPIPIWPSLTENAIVSIGDPGFELLTNSTAKDESYWQTANNNQVSSKAEGKWWTRSQTANLSFGIRRADIFSNISDNRYLALGGESGRELAAFQYVGMGDLQFQGDVNLTVDLGRASATSIERMITIIGFNDPSEITVDIYSDSGEPIGVTYSGSAGFEQFTSGWTSDGVNSNSGVLNTVSVSGTFSSSYEYIGVLLCVRDGSSIGSEFDFVAFDNIVVTADISNPNA